MSIIQKIVHGPNRQPTLLGRIRASSEPVLIYGAGVYAYVLQQYLCLSGITIAMAMVDTAYKFDETFMGLPIVTTEEMTGHLADFQIVVGTTNYPSAVERLTRLGAKHIFVIDVPDFLNMPHPFMDRTFVERNIDAFDEAYALLDDDLSRQTYLAAINAKVEENVEHIKPYVRPDHLYFTKEFPISAEEILLDVGGFTGDSVRDYHAISKGRYRRIISLEPFELSFVKLTEFVATHGLSRVTPVRIGAWDSKTVLSFQIKRLNIDNRIIDGGDAHIDVDTIDALVSRLDTPITYIKMDINGAEYRALTGARETIKRNRPNLAIKMHVKEDFYRLPILLKQSAPGMRLHLRQRGYFSMLLVLYGRPA